MIRNPFPCQQDTESESSPKRRCLFLFVSVHQVMKAEKLFKSQGLKVDLIPMPREISSDCGVAIELPWESRKEALGCLNEHHVSIASWYVWNQGRYEEGKEE
mgnify:CR=1 FL=1